MHIHAYTSQKSTVERKEEFLSLQKKKCNADLWHKIFLLY